jgi:hypothetical protein
VPLLTTVGVRRLAAKVSARVITIALHRVTQMTPAGPVKLTVRRLANTPSAGRHVPSLVLLVPKSAAQDANTQVVVAFLAQCRAMYFHVRSAVSRSLNVAIDALLAVGNCVLPMNFAKLVLQNQSCSRLLIGLR